MMCILCERSRRFFYSTARPFSFVHGSRDNTCMSLLRAAASPLLAAPFVGYGWDALTHPKRHVEHVQRYRRVFDAVEDATGIPVTDEFLSATTRLLGAATTASSLCFALGYAPRAHAAFLASVGIPMAFINNPQAARPGYSDQRRDLMLRMALCAGFTFAALDRRGRPSLSWRLADSHARRTRSSAALSTRASSSSSTPRVFAIGEGR